MNQFLSQEEVDALLRGITDGEVVTEQSAGEDADHIRPYDLTSQERIIRGRMPTLEIINQKFSRLLRASLSGSLRRVIDVGAQNVEMIKFGENLSNEPKLKESWSDVYVNLEAGRLAKRFQRGRMRQLSSYGDHGISAQWR